jgi:WW domain.
MSFYNSYPPPLPPGWIPTTDPVSGNIYYANPSTGETSWQPPPPHPVPIITNPHIVPISSHDNNLQPRAVHSIPPSEPTIQKNVSRRLLLVPAARAIINKHNTSQTVQTDSGATESSTPHDPLELHMKAGMISDLVKVQHQYRIEQAEAADTTENHNLSIQTYEPLKPFELPLGKCVDAVAEKRVDVRLMQLMDELSKISAE